MKREIYEVHLTLVDANGNVTIDPSGYPKIEDSKLRDNDPEKARMRAFGLLGEIEKSMSTQDTRQIQYGYIIRVSDGMQIEKRLFGKLADLPDPKYTVTVTNGTGSGEYIANERVEIYANEEEGMAFAGWTGTEGLTFVYGNANSAHAAFAMPSENVSIEATYVPKNGGES